MLIADLSCPCYLYASGFIPCSGCTGQAAGPACVIKMLNWRQVQCDWIRTTATGVRGIRYSDFTALTLAEINREFGYTHQSCCLQQANAVRLSFKPHLCYEKCVHIDIHNGLPPLVLVRQVILMSSPPTQSVLKHPKLVYFLSWSCILLR